MLDEDAYFCGEPAACRSNRKDWDRSFKGSQKAYHSTFPEFSSEEPRWRLRNPQMFKDTHPHLFNIAGSKYACGDNALGIAPGAKAPRLHRAPLDERDTAKAVEIVRRFRCAVPCKVLRSSDQNDHRLRKPSCDQSGVWKIT